MDNPPPDPLPRGLVFFRAGTSPAYRRQRLLFVAVVALAALAVIAPLYPLFATAPFPLILGLPRSLAWVVLWLGIVLAALVWLYRREPRQEA